MQPSVTPSGAEGSVDKLSRRSLLAPSFAGYLAKIATMSALDEAADKLLNSAIWLLCAYDSCAEDICTVLAHACVYFEDYQKTPAGSAMGPRQAVHIFIVHMYLANSLMTDEAVPLKTWHRQLSKDYCTLHMLNSVVIKLMKARDYKLLLEEGDVRQRYEKIVAGCHHRHTMATK